MKKIRVTISELMYEILKEDGIYFNLPIGKIGNILLQYYSNRSLNKVIFNKTSTKKIQFNLTKENEENFYEIFREKDVSTEAELMRDIFFTYINNLRSKREEILFFESFIKIRKAIEQNKKISIKYRGITRRISPYFIGTYSKENRNYLFCWCEKNEDYRNYRVSDIESIYILEQELELVDEEYIKNIKENFDPFLSFGKIVKVRIREEGKELLERAVHNRPRILEINEDIYTFECNEKLAKIYFAQFYDSVEILEPESLREDFKRTIKKIEEIYLNEK